MAARSGGNGSRPGLDGGPDEYVDFGRSPSPRRRWLLRALLASLVVVAIVIVAGRSGPRRPAPPPPVAVIRLGHPLFGIRAGWELFGLDSARLVAIALARGTITTTALPSPEGSGLVSLIVQPRSVLIRPLDDVPGYLVPDGKAARPLTGSLAAGSLLLPGPVSTETWVVPGTGNVLHLIGPDEDQTGTLLTLPPGRWAAQSAMADGRGGVLVSSDSGRQYDADPTPLTPVGALLAAVGPTRWLGVSCRPGPGPCRTVVVDPVTDAQRRLPGPALRLRTWPWPYEPGVVAPDGRQAAVVVASGRLGVTLELISLASGAVRPVPVPVTEAASSQTLAWSPDSGWLFVIAADGQLTAVNARTDQVHRLGVRLPDFTQIAVRAG